MRRVAGTIISRIKFGCPAGKKHDDNISLYKRNILAPQQCPFAPHIFPDSHPAISCLCVVFSSSGWC